MPWPPTSVIEPPTSPKIGCRSSSFATGDADHVLHEDVGQQDHQEDHERLAALLQHAQVGAHADAGEEHQQQHRLDGLVDRELEVRRRPDDGGDTRRTAARR